MPKRKDIKSILLIGSGPIVIGQACEFDYSGTQAIKALKEEGYRVILVNSNPATIMTDPNFADKTYIEPITADYVEKIIEKERPDAVLPTMGGQTALNTALELDERGVFQKYNCELIGAKIDSIKTAEDRELFRQAMDEIGLQSAKSFLVKQLSDASQCVEQLGFPLILRPSRTLGGTGGGIVHNEGELEGMIKAALVASPNSEVLVEKSLLGWKEIELEVMRDKKDNVVIICAIENIDPMGVHTGDSITVAPVQTLTDKEYQLLRDAAIKIIRKIGVETGGSNVQFAMNPKNGEIMVIEMNPRVSRSSALASKATGFPIAKFAAKLAIGYTLDEIQNDITKETPACFEPTIDYVVVKIPRFNFEKFPNAKNELGTQMKSVGEALSFGRNFTEAIQKAMYSMEMDTFGFDFEDKYKDKNNNELLEICRKPHSTRLWAVGESLRRGSSIEELYATTAIDPWFLAEIKSIIDTEEKIKNKTIDIKDKETLYKLKRMGFADRRIAKLLGLNEEQVSQLRSENKIEPSYLTIDTCAGEFKASTPYLYSSYERKKVNNSQKLKEQPVIILGSGPNRIGQGIEFDYCCVQAVFALKESGIPAIMVNSNPETVSTDYDISDKLYFEPLTFESVYSIVKEENPRGVILQFGGQTPLKLAKQLKEAGVNILGTSVESIDKAEDRKEFNQLIEQLNLKQPKGAIAYNVEEAIKCGNEIGYPVLMRPSFVLGGRAMRIVHSESELKEYIAETVSASAGEGAQKKSVLIDEYLSNAIEVDVDAISDGKDVVIAGVMEHIERAGVHSGDSSCVLPPFSLSKEVIARLEEQATKLAKALDVVGFLNVQFAVTKDEEVFILEANPRASRTVPFVSKATGIPWAKIATNLMSGKTLKELGITKSIVPKYSSVKACVFPFNKFPGADIILGPEMKSTGEVMGIGNSFAVGFAKSQFATNTKLPKSGNVFVSVMDKDKAEILPAVAKLVFLGFGIYATSGTAEYLKNNGIKSEVVNKVKDGSPHVVDLLKAGMIQIVINTPEGSQPHLDSRSIRISAMELSIPTYTTVAAAISAVEALQKIIDGQLHEVMAIQDYHKQL